MPALLQVDRAALLEQLERRRPKAQLEDLALARQDIVGDADAPHRGQVAGHDRIRDHRPELGNLALAGFQGVQSLGAPSEGPLVFGREQPRDLGVQVPAEMVEAGAGIDRQGAHGIRALLPQVVKGGHHVSHLHAGVVDVVLHLDSTAERAQQAHERVAEHGVAEMADVRRLVGVDVRVLDDHLGRRSRYGLAPRQHGGGIGGPVEAGVDVTGARRLERADAFYRGELGDQLGSDLPRSPAQGLGEAEADRSGEVSVLRLARQLGHHLDLRAVALRDMLRQCRLKALLKRQQHRSESPQGRSWQDLRAPEIRSLAQGWRGRCTSGLCFFGSASPLD